MLGFQRYPNGHGDKATPDNEARHARFPLSISLPQAGERWKVSLREIHVKGLEGDIKTILPFYIPLW